MTRSTSVIRLMGPILLGGALLAGCGTAPQAESTSAPMASADGASISADNSVAEDALRAEANSPGSVPAIQPQLARTAALTVGVEQVEPAIDAVMAIARQHRGDLLGLQDSPSMQSRPQVSISLRVPQAEFDATLDQLETLGQTQERSITAEDVSTQQVDLQARLRNLRKTEEMLLTLMNRSGDMADVLKVAQEVSNVRTTIEQLDAQATALQTRVTFSTIQLTLEGAIAPTAQRSATAQLQETWTNSTASLGQFTVGLLQLGLWLLVYSPYWLPLSIAAVWYFRSRSASPVERTSTPGQP